jgi:hypothetical protein
VLQIWRSRLTSTLCRVRSLAGSSVLWRGRRADEVLVLFGGKVAVATLGSETKAADQCVGQGVPRARCPNEPSTLVPIPKLDGA